MSYKNIWKPGDIITTKKWNSITNFGFFYPKKVILGEGYYNIDNDTEFFFLPMTIEELDLLFSQNNDINYYAYFGVKSNNEFVEFYLFQILDTGVDDNNNKNIYGLYWPDDPQIPAYELDYNFTDYGDNYLHAVRWTMLR